MNYIKNRSEFLFVYDVKDANPNGDPLDENKPRIDEETGQVIVTDVRLKRTIRDYLATVKGLDVFIIETRDENGDLRTKEDRTADFKDDPNLILERCIDMRLFGATTAIKGKTITWTGPVQFKFGRSLHKVDGPILIKGTTVMPSKEGKKQGTFREEWTVPYALIAFHGVANEYAAQTTHLTEEDLDLMIEAMWNGTKDLITRSKFGQIPRLLLRIIYKEGADFYIGELDKLIRWRPGGGRTEEQVRDITEGTLNVEKLLKTIDKHKDKIKRIEIAVHERLKTEPEILKGLKEKLGENAVKLLELP
ncbi:MAG: type I-B CRISPR-associated protein Cas7/Csh2 [Deltaproteobacteria bacterium]|nr:MAG: type I-B CRISPR-associated protein Cas7/Csh2 [Deltaproteobacteria bacterium]RLC72249.1 MAG: type I-B CRISPR-associated protein Cas7/Csh2 [Chloroflexota bacterium]